MLAAFAQNTNNVFGLSRLHNYIEPPEAHALLRRKRNGLEQPFQASLGLLRLICGFGAVSCGF